MRVYIYIYSYIYIYTHHIHIHIYIYICNYLYVCVWVHICMYVCMYVRMYACRYVCRYVCMYVCMYACPCCFSIAGIGKWMWLGIWGSEPITPARLRNGTRSLGYANTTIVERLCLSPHIPEKKKTRPEKSTSHSHRSMTQYYRGPNNYQFVILV